MTNTIEQKEAYNKMIEINDKFNSFENLTNPDYIVWWRKLNDLCIDLCDSIYWEDLMTNMEFVKSKRTA